MIGKAFIATLILSLLGAVTLLGATLLAGAPAQAQQTPPVATKDLETSPVGPPVGSPDIAPVRDEQLYCVFDKLKAAHGGVSLVTGVYLGGGDSEEEKAAEELLGRLARECAQSFGWGLGPRGKIATTFAVQNTLIDVLTDELGASIAQEKLAKVSDLLDTLPGDDVAKFKTGEWKQDEEFQERLKKLLVSAGLPGNTFLLDGVLQLMDASIIGSLAQNDWKKLPPS